MVTYQAVSPLYKAIWELGVSNRVTIEYVEDNTVLICMSNSGGTVQHALTLCELTLMKDGVAQEIIKGMVNRLSKHKAINYMKLYSAKGPRLKDL